MRLLHWALALTLSHSSIAAHIASRKQSAVKLDIPLTSHGASILHAPSFVSFSFEPAFWVEFFGDASEPNQFTFDVLSRIVQHGGQPHIRPGGITMDSMIFEPTAGNPVRVTNADGGVYRTTVGPPYYKSWSNFPKGTKFTSTLNFGNNSLAIARDMAVASVKYQPDLVEFFELGNEPNNYADAGTRWDNSTQQYVNQWKDWTANIDATVNATLGKTAAAKLGLQRWWASSATTDDTTLQVKPVDIIPDGVDSAGQVAQYSIHSYQFATCDPSRAALATIPNILNHTSLVSYADEEIMPSARAALDSGSQWIIGEYNSIACSGNPNVSDAFAQALWTIDMQLIYAVRNASATYLHQGATLVFQSSDQVNQAGQDGSPGYSTYDMLYPRSSGKRGEARTLPGFLGVLFTVEALANPGTQVRALEPSAGVDADYFSAYSLYVGGKLTKLVILNMYPYYSDSTSDHSVTLDIAAGFTNDKKQAWAKRLTASSADETNSQSVSWAGQSYESGKPTGNLVIETIGSSGTIEIRGSQALLISFDKMDVYGMS